MKSGNNDSSSNIIKPDENQEAKDKKLIEQSKPDTEEPEKVWFFQLFRFAEKIDYILMLVGSLAAITMGTAYPAFSFIMGKMAIARTILRNPQILLLDEATSALDSENEKKVQDSLDSIMQGKTVISVAHRIETIKNSDTIYMFEKGKIIESGSYN